MRTSPESAPWASDASAPASAYAPRSATRPFKPMEATQSGRAEEHAVRGRQPLPAYPQQRSGRERRGKRGSGARDERNAQLRGKPTLAQPNELERSRSADDR